MKLYGLIIIKDQKMRMEFFEEYYNALHRVHNLNREWRDEECEFIVYRTCDNVICFTCSQREDEE